MADNKKYLDEAGLAKLVEQIKTQTASKVNGRVGEVTLTKADVGLSSLTDDAQVKRSEMGAASGVAQLDEAGKVPAAQLPSYVDDVVEAASKNAFPAAGEAGKIYVSLDDNKTWRWGGTAYVEISQSLALGETSSTAYSGDKGKANADAIAALGTRVDSESAGAVASLDQQGDVLTAKNAAGESKGVATLKYATAFTDDDLVMPTAVGGIPAGTTVGTLKAKKYGELLDMLLFPEAFPQVTAPSASISLKAPFANNGIYEVGAAAPTASDFNASFNRGSATVAGQPAKQRAGAQTSNEIQANGAAGALPSTVPLGATTYRNHVEHGAGDELLTSYGAHASKDKNGSNIANPLPAGSVNSGNVTINGTYPFFCNGVAASETAAASSLPAAVADGTKLPLKLWTATLIGAAFASEASTNTHNTFDFPAAKKVTKVEMYNTVSGKWDIELTDYSTAAIADKTVQGQAVSYKRLTMGGDLAGARQLRFTIANA